MRKELTALEVQTALDRAPGDVWMLHGNIGPESWLTMGDIRVSHAEMDADCDGGWRIHFNAVDGGAKGSGSICWFFRGDPTNDFYCWKPATGRVDLSRFPHKCPRCSKPAYVGATAAVDCTNAACPTKVK